jgi:catechol 2,3-dioxygenase-like lactoylglutathione lyase family enzyme
MAYRFLLEVPEALADEAGIAVAAAGDAQVVVRRSKAHNQPYTEPYIDMTVAAHSLEVTQTLVAWHESLRPATRDIGIVLHSGERLALKEHSRSSLVAAIRRDQPWVERTVPKIGDHEEDYRMADLTRSRSAAAGVATLDVSEQAVAPAKAFNVRAVNHIAIRVTNLRRAEEFYGSFLEMDVLGRMKMDGEDQIALPDDFAWDVAGEHGADVAYMENGPLVLAVHRVGMGARIERALLEHISLRVDAASFTQIKGLALMRGYEVIGQSETDFAFRDPFNVVWDLNLAGNPVFASPFQ